MKARYLTPRTVLTSLKYSQLLICSKLVLQLTEKLSKAWLLPEQMVSLKWYI